MIWQWIVQGIARFLVQFKLFAASIVARVLATFGLSVVTFDTLLPGLKAFVLQYATGLSSEAAAILGYLGIGQAFSMILSALTVRLAWKVFIIPTSVANNLEG